MKYIPAFNMAPAEWGLQMSFSCLLALGTTRRYFSLLGKLSKPYLSLKDPLTQGCRGCLKHSCNLMSLRERMQPTMGCVGGNGTALS